MNSNRTTSRFEDKSSHQKAFIPDRRPTIHELASVTFMGVKEQRPAEMLKAELQSSVLSRAPFYRPAEESGRALHTQPHDTKDNTQQPSKKLELPKIREMNKFLKMKYNHKKELSNISRGEAKSPPFITDIDRHPKAVKQLQPLTTTHPAQAKKLKQYRVSSSLFSLQD